MILDDNELFFDYTYTNNILTIKIPIPKNYNSELSTKLNNSKSSSRKNTFGFLSLSYGVDFFGKSSNTVYLHAFYIHANDFKKILTSEEKKIFKGMGKQMLCFAIKTLCNKFTIFLILEEISDIP